MLATEALSLLRRGAKQDVLVANADRKSKKRSALRARVRIKRAGGETIN